jgi:hypothetical protein
MLNGFYGEAISAFVAYKYFTACDDTPVGSNR